MPLEHERAFSANSPVGRYWLRNCVGFRVEGFRVGTGIVDEIGLGPDGVDVLAVRLRGISLRRMILVPTQRVESVHPWDDTIVLARKRGVGAQRTARARDVTNRLRPVARASAVETARLLRDGTIVIRRLLAALGTLLLGLAVVLHKRAPGVGRYVATVASAYAHEAKRAWRAERDAIATWRGSRRSEGADEPADDGPLTRAGADEVDVRPRDVARRR